MAQRIAADTLTPWLGGAPFRRVISKEFQRWRSVLNVMISTANYWLTGAPNNYEALRIDLSDGPNNFVSISFALDIQIAEQHLEYLASDFFQSFFYRGGDRHREPIVLQNNREHRPETGFIVYEQETIVAFVD